MGYLESRYQPSIYHLPIDSDAFKIEYQRNISSQALRKDVISYLGEYRFQIPRFDYSLLYSYGDNGLKIRDVNDKVAMTTKAQRAIDKRLAKGHQGISREVAELAGLTSLENQLKTAKNGDQIFWVSPPGKKEDGYGEYGFIYTGTIEGEKLKMSAVRVEQPALKQFNNFFSSVTGRVIKFQEAKEFLASPYIKTNGSLDTDRLLFSFFNFQLDENKQRLFKSSIQRLTPYIENFIYLVKQGLPKTQLLTVFHALENYALELINNPSFGERSNTFGGHFSIAIPFDQLVKQYGYTPPTALGSCGSTKTDLFGKSNMLFEGRETLLKSIKEDSEHYEDYACPHCGGQVPGEKKNNRQSWIHPCPHCGKMLGQCVK